jgi:hypothetical protein
MQGLDPEQSGLVTRLAFCLYACITPEGQRPEDRHDKIGFKAVFDRYAGLAGGVVSADTLCLLILDAVKPRVGTFLTELGHAMMDAMAAGMNCFCFFYRFLDVHFLSNPSLPTMRFVEIPLFLYDCE